MVKLQRFLVVLSLLVAPALFAQSADVALTVTDLPDPVSRDGTITYTVQVTNNGPNAATNAAMTVYNSTGLGFVSINEPAGWSCAEPGAGAFVQFSCTNASLASGATSTFTLVTTTDTAYYGNNEGTINTSFTAGSSTSDPANGNNAVQTSTAYIVPDADMSVTASDSPDPVNRDGTITYTVNVSNAGPDPGLNAVLSVNNSSGLGFVSVTEPAGWSCTEPAAGAFVQFSCTNPSLASGATSTFTVVATTDTVYYGNNEGPITTSFSVGSDQSDPNHENNLAQPTTAYVAPDADTGVTVTDSPDPVFPGGTITYTVQVSNAGPDPAANAILSVTNNSGLGFVSVTEPAGWSCTEPAPGAFVQFSCSNPSLASGATSTFTVVATTDTVYYGNAETTITTSFGVGSDQIDANDANNVENETTAYVTPDADLSITASDSPDPVDRGENITYTVTLANAGPDSAAATLNVPMNGTLKFVSHTVPAGFVCTGVPAAGSASTYSCTDTTFESGANAVFTIVLNVDPNAFGIHDGTINQAFSVTGNVTDPDGNDNIATVSTTYDPATSDVGVTATDSPDPVNAGSNITYTGTVTNAGPDAAANATFQIPMHPSLLFQSLTGPAGFTCNPPAVGGNALITCTIASLASGASIPFTFVARVNPSLASGPDGVIEQSFLAGTSNGDPVAANNELDVFTQYLTPDADISVTNSDTPDPVLPGGTITYTQTLTNNGPNPATNVTFTETLPASVGFVSIAPAAGYTCTTPAVGASGTITCSIASLASGATGTFTVIVNVEATSGTIGNTVTGDSDTNDPDGTDNVAGTTTTIVAGPTADLSVTKSTNATSASPGTDITYAIVLTNNGPDAATAVVLTDTLPAQLQFRSITRPTGFTCTTPAIGANGTITCNAATMANGATATFTLVARVAPGATSGTITNTASVSAATGDPDGGDSSGSSGGVALAPASADLAIVKTTTTTTAPAGSTFSYTITLTNGGPNAASSVVMTDVLPASLLFQSIAAPAGFTCTTPAAGANGTVTCNAATLANGANAVFTLTVRVASGSTSGTATNTAGVTSATADPDNGDTSDPAPPVTLAPASSDVSITKSTNTTSASTGQTVTWTIGVSNAGPSIATNVVVTDTLPAGVQFVSATPSQGTCSGTTNVTCSLGNLASGANATITLQAVVTATSGTISNTASVSTTGDPDNTDNSTTTPPFPVGEPATPAQIPTLSEWALIALAMMMAAIAMRKMV
jgi:uncharacterized repeat protein (TIGR01451 family)